MLKSRGRMRLLTRLCAVAALAVGGVVSLGVADRSATASTVTAVVSESAIVSNNAFIRHNFAEVGARPNGSFGSDVSAPNGWNPRGTRQTIGFVADREKDGWGVGIDDGDFFLPGGAFEGWALEVLPDGGSANTTYNHDLATGIAGTFSAPDSAASRVQWSSTAPFEGVDVHKEYWLPSDGGQTLNVDVTLTNTNLVDVQIVYLRAVDADNCVDRESLLEPQLDLCSGKFFPENFWQDFGFSAHSAYTDYYFTQNTIEFQRAAGAAVSAVSASERDGSFLVLWSADSDSVVLGGAANPSAPQVYGGFCRNPGNLRDLYSLEQTYTPDTSYDHRAHGCGWYYNKVGEGYQADDMIYLLVAKTIPAGGDVSFSLAYSLSLSSFEASAGVVVGEQTPSALIPPPPPSSVSTTTTTPTTTTTVPPTTVPPTTVPAASTTVPAPVPDGDALPVLVPGASQVLENGVPASVEVFVDNSTDLVLRGQSFELRLAGECSSGCTIDTTADGRQVLTLEEGGRANVSGEGFQPGTTVFVWLFSEPRFLGQLTVAADGTFQGSVALGDIASGEHTLQVNGTSTDGSARTANLGVVVNPAAAPMPGPGVLPATGVDASSMWLVALVLLGVGLVAVGRRRAPAPR